MSGFQRNTGNAYACGVQSKITTAMDALLKFPSIEDDVERQGLTHIVVQQTLIPALEFSLLQSDPLLPLPQHSCSHALWFNEAGVFFPIGQYIESDPSCNHQFQIRASEA
ncbi:hypothetical protein TNCV_662441 [Trichonephila clavipes]|nr:hypothetical protein TNCV_662441 [Trichonephila clavipes]